VAASDAVPAGWGTSGSARPAVGGWRPGDPLGSRRFAALGSLVTESGAVIQGLTVAYESYGTPERDEQGRITNAVLVCHALTGDSHVTGPAGPGHPTPGWWRGVVGHGCALDPAEWFIVSPNMLGGCQGTTGPSSPHPDGGVWGSRFPQITIRDQVRAEIMLADNLGVRSWAGVFGGSMGAMRVLEWLAMAPSRVQSALVLAAGLKAHADQIGAYYAQLSAIESDPLWNDGDYYRADRHHGPFTGMAIARRLAQLTYRGADEIQQRFGNQPQPGEDPYSGGRFSIESYLDHHADTLVARFDPATYVVATRAMNTHDVGRGRGGAAAALARATMPVVVAGVTSDRLYPLDLQREVADAIPGCTGLEVVHSPRGHDAFLLEREAVGELVRHTLGRTTLRLVANG
jgi:homoserine O-acetyltransferase